MWKLSGIFPFLQYHPRPVLTYTAFHSRVIMSSCYTNNCLLLLPIIYKIYVIGIIPQNCRKVSKS